MNGHPVRDEDFDLLALGALEGEKKQSLEAHAASCADCSRRLAEARGRIAMLAFAAPEAAPSRAGKRRLLAHVRETSAPTAEPERSPARQPRLAPSSWSRGWSAILIPVGAALAALTIFLWHENHVLDRQLAALRASRNDQQQQFDEAREIAELVSSKSTLTIPLAQQPGMPKGHAHVMYNAKMNLIMYDGEIAPAPATKTYQLWLVPAKGHPISCGVFGGEPDHRMMKVPEGTAPKWFTVTLEPAGGMPRPTGPMVLMGSVS